MTDEKFEGFLVRVFLRVIIIPLMIVFGFAYLDFKISLGDVFSTVCFVNALVLFINTFRMKDE